MHASQKIVPSSPNSSSICSSVVPGEQNMDGIVLSTFKLKPVGSVGARNTRVDNDSLSSYSWPDETNRQNGANRTSGTPRDSNENGKGFATLTIPKSHTVLDIKNPQEAKPFQEPTYVEAYMKFMYWTCISPFNPSRTWDCRGKSSRFGLILNIVQKITFAAIIGFSFVKSFFQVKYNLIYYMTLSDMESFIDMMFYIMSAGTKVYYVYLFVFLQKRFSQMLISLEKLRAFRMPTLNSNKMTIRSTMKYAVKLGTSSIIMTFIQTIFYSGVFRWTPQKGILVHSHGTALGLLLWSTENSGNDTWFDSIEHEYRRETNTTTILLGAFGLIIHFCSYLHNEATGDLMQTQAETLREEMQCLQNQINKTENDERNITLTGFFRENGEWAHSRLLTQAIDSCNDTLDHIMRYKHINNLMLYVFFVLNFLDGDYSLAFLVYLLYDICKSSYTYRIAAEASTINESKMKWIRRLAWKSNDNEFLKRVPLLLGEIKENPIGMGKGQFLINESFLYRFLGWVGSVFVLQAQSREAKTEWVA